MKRINYATHQISKDCAPPSLEGRETDRVDIICDEGASQTTRDDVRCYDERDEKAGSVNIHTCECGYDLTASKDQASSNKHVGSQTVEEVGQVGDLAVSREYDLREAAVYVSEGYTFDRLDQILTYARQGRWP